MKTRIVGGKKYALQNLQQCHDADQGCKSRQRKATGVRPRVQLAKLVSGLEYLGKGESRRTLKDCILFSVQIKRGSVVCSMKI